MNDSLAMDLSDIQGLVRASYDHLPYARFLFLEIEDSEKARGWIGRLHGEVATAQHWKRGEHPKPRTRVNVGFTASGLARLGFSASDIEKFPLEFRDGMAGINRSPILGDVGENAPEHWQVGGPHQPDPHTLLLLYAHTEAELDEMVQAPWNPYDPANGVREVFRQDSLRENANEPFGFRDGISQPAIEGLTHRPGPGQELIKAGEFLLGYDNEYDQLPPMPVVAAAEDPDGILPPAPGDATARAFGHNGTYLVWRKLSQDVDGFWNFLDEQTKNPDGTRNEQARTWLAAKLVGRWPSGAPLVLAPDRDDPELGADEQRNNDFLFMQDDPHGYACPIGSHVRRANPRDSLQAGPRLSTIIARRRRLLRRGRPYADPAPANGTPVDRGLIFIILNADIGHQFEFVQQTWVSSPKFGGLYESPDPLVGLGGADAQLVIQQKPVRKRICGLPRFVTLKGGGYFFLPSMTALRFLAEHRSPTSPD